MLRYVSKYVCMGGWRIDLGVGLLVHNAHALLCMHVCICEGENRPWRRIVHEECTYSVVYACMYVGGIDLRVRLLMQNTHASLCAFLCGEWGRIDLGVGLLGRLHMLLFNSDKVSPAKCEASVSFTSLLSAWHRLSSQL